MTEQTNRPDTSHPGADMEVFEQPEYRVEGPLKVTGRARYAADVQLPDMLWAAFLGSPVPHARIVSIDTSAAKSVPGVHAVLTGADIGLKLYGRGVFDMPVLAVDRVRFIGDRVAAVAAETREQAEEAVNLIEVAYQELPAVFDHETALAPDAPVLHSGSADYFSTVPRYEVPHPNLQGYTLVERGEPDLEAIFARAHRVVEDTYTAPRQHQGYIEPHACVVGIDDDGTVRVYAANKNPFRFREQMAVVTGVPREKIVVDSRFVGGDFGGKGHSMGELPTYYLAKASGRPVKSVQSYVDELGASNPRHATVCTLRTAVDDSGAIIAHEWKAYYHGGAYMAPKPSIWPAPTWSALEVYRVKNARQEQFVVYTNTVPAGHVRAPGAVQMALAGEGHIDHIAREIGMDPLEFRLRNVVREGDESPSGDRYRNPRGVAVLEALKREVGWGEGERKPGYGRGIALRARHVGQGKTSVVLTLLPDGSIEALYGTPDQGSGSQTLLRRVAASVLSVSPERITIRYGDTDEAPTDGGAGASRVTHVVGQAAIGGATILKERLEELAAEVMGWPSGDVRLDHDQFLAGGESVPFDEVARRIRRTGSVVARGEYDSGDTHHEDGGDFNFCAYMVEVHVDAETGRVRPTEAVLAYDVGQIINPIGHQGQLDGSFVYGLGNTLMEEMIEEDGRVTTLNLGDYKLPTQMDTVPLRTVLVPTGVGPGPFGAKAAGEAVNSPVGPAIANAVYDAVGVRIKTLPISAERVYQALRESK